MLDHTYMRCVRIFNCATSPLVDDKVNKLRVHAVMSVADVVRAYVAVLLLVGT